MIQAQCGTCQKKYVVPDQFAGKKMKCKACSGIVTIPAAPAIETAPPPPPLEPAAEEPAAAAPAPPAGAKKPFGTKPAFKKGAFGAGAGAGVGAKKGFVPAKKPLGSTRPTVPAKRAEVRSRAPEETEGADAGGERAVVGEGKRQEKTLLLVGASLVILTLACFAYWYFFMSSSKTPEKVVKKPKETPAKTETAEPAGEKDTAKKDAEKKEVAAEEKEAKDAEPEEADKAAPADALKPLDPLDILPANLQVVGNVELARVINIPVVRSGIEDALKQNTEIADGMKSVGFDPLGSLKTLWFGATIPPNVGPETPPDFVFLVDGIFDRQRIVDGLKGWPPAQAESKKEGPFEVLTSKPAAGPPVKLAFVSEEQVLLGTPALFDAALKLAGGGKSVKDNAKLKAISKDFQSQALVWVAAELSKELKEQVANYLRTSAEEPGAKMDGALVSIDVADDGGLKVDAMASCATEAEAKKLHLAAGAKLVAVNAMVPMAGGVKLKPPAGKTVSASIEVPAQVLDQLKAQLGGPGLTPPGTTPDAQPGEKPGEEPAAEPAPGEEKEEKTEKTKKADKAPKMEKPAEGDKPEEKADSKPEEKSVEKEEKSDEKEEKTEDADSK